MFVCNLFLLDIFENARNWRSQAVFRRIRAGLLGGNQLAAVFEAAGGRLLADHPAHSFAAFSAVYRGVVVPVNLRRGASARRNGVVHFRRIEAAADANDHASDLQ